MAFTLKPAEGPQMNRKLLFQWHMINIPRERFLMHLGWIYQPPQLILYHYRRKVLISKDTQAIYSIDDPIFGKWMSMKYELMRIL